MLGLIGKKIGMTQVFKEDGTVVPVTVVKAGPCTVVQKKTPETDGYYSLQLGFEPRPRGTTKPLLGHFKKHGVNPMRYLREFRLEGDVEYKEGDEITVNIFKVGEKVKVTGYSKGRGFQGVIKRWGFSGGKETHGCKSHRVPGSIGASSDPSRVWKGQKLPGRMASKRVTIKNLEIVDIDPSKHLLLLKGAVPGARNGLILVTKQEK